MMTKKEATAAGKALLKQLEGKGWRLRVHENCGWHFAVVNDYMSVYRSGIDGMYSTLLSTQLERCSGAGEVYWTDELSFSDTNEAVAHQLELARQHLAKVQTVVTYLEKALGQEPEPSRAPAEAPTDTINLADRQIDREIPFGMLENGRSQSVIRVVVVDDKHRRATGFLSVRGQHSRVKFCLTVKKQDNRKALIRDVTADWSKPANQK